MNIVVFGSGKVGKKILSYPLKKGSVIICVCDNDSKKWNTEICGYKILPPEKVLKQADCIVLAITSAQYEVYEQLLSKNIQENKIIRVTSSLKLDYFETPLDALFDIKKKTFAPFVKNKLQLLGKTGAESTKARARRVREGFFEKYCNGEGLDIGCGDDPVVSGCSGWDIIHGDAQYLNSIGNEEFDFVYSSHCLEHVDDVRCALRNWFRVVRKNGYLILYIPHRDLYEKKKTLPSRFNPDHKHMFLIGEKEHPDTLDIVEEIREGLSSDGGGYEVEYVKACAEGYVRHSDCEQSDGEYSIECVIKKKA